MRTEYESWLIEAVYEIADQSLFVKENDHLIYMPDGTPPNQKIYANAAISLGDWKPSFLDAGAPLVFITDFKLLDMLFEWILTNNERAPDYRFEKKIKSLKKKEEIEFPPLIEIRPWLRDRLIALYEYLEPLRGTIIHNRHFKSQNGSLEVSSTRGGEIGSQVTITSKDLRNLSLLIISLLRYLEGEWGVDLFGEKRIRYTLDELKHLHQLTSLGQLPPNYISIRIYIRDEEDIQLDMGRICNDVKKSLPGQDVIFDLRLITISRDGSNAKAYLIPWQQLQGCGSDFCMKRDELESYPGKFPHELDKDEIARVAKLF